MKKNILKISVFSMMGILLLGAADAAPTIKKLGGTVPGVNVTAQKNENLTPARTGSVRLNTSNVIKTGGVPAAAKINTAKIPEANAARLSLGKYLHPAGVKAETTSSGPAVASQDVINLRDKVNVIEGDVNTHVSNTDIHVSEEDRQRWNLEAGDGITIENGKISADMLLPVNSFDGERKAEIWVE